MGALLSEWAGLTPPDLKTSAPIDFPELDADTGRLLFLINGEPQPARIDLGVPAAKSVHEITTGAPTAVANGARILAEVPAQGVRIYRVDY